MSELAKKEHCFVNPFETKDKYRDINQGVVAVEAERAIADARNIDNTFFFILYLHIELKNM